MLKRKKFGINSAANPAKKQKKNDWRTDAGEEAAEKELDALERPEDFNLSDEEEEGGFCGALW